MNLPLFIAWRYVFSKKKLGVIHVISTISLVGIAIATMALMVVLSVFNGFTSVASDMLSRSNPPLIIEAKKGKTINISELNYKGIISLDGIKSASCVIEESALLSFGQRQAIVKIRTSDSITGKCLLGEGLAYFMGFNSNYSERGLRLKFTIPKRENNVSALIPEDNFNQENIFFGGTFSTLSKLDENYVLVPQIAAQNLLNYDSNTFTSIFITPKQVSKTKTLQKQITQIIGEKYIVKNLFEQEPIYYKVVKAEKLGVYIILAFIVFIATFNIVGSLSLLILDKKKDINILRTMGMSLPNIRKIYFYNGLVLSILGSVIGIAVGLILCLIQSKFSLIKMGGNNFLVDAFPVKIIAYDIINIFWVAVSIGILCIGIMVRRLK
ncbi:MAG: FtsX-like permease family protein [Bacteroidales bacterium]|jgi:lipoprotein-releasing system permease protein|nr:FtsX-like permease family protein [Bacteroidales bacterium]